MSSARVTMWLSEIDKLDRHLAGERAVSLGELMKAKFPVRDGFVITQTIGDEFGKLLAQESLEGRLLALRASHGSLKEKLVKQIKDLMRRTPLPKEVEQQIIRAYLKLTEKTTSEMVLMRPSHVLIKTQRQSETGSKALVTGEARVLEVARDWWAEWLIERAESTKLQSLSKLEKEMSWAIIIQAAGRMEWEGRILTVNPSTGEKNSLVIEVTKQILKTGKEKQISDFYEVNKYVLGSVSTKNELENSREKSGKISSWFKWPNSKKNQSEMDEKLIQGVAKLGAGLEQHYFGPQEIEWWITDGDYAVMSVKPLAGLSKGERQNLPAGAKLMEATRHLRQLIGGIPGSKGAASGYARVLRKPGDIKQVKKGEIVVTESWRKEWEPIFKKAKGLILADSDLMSKGARVCREIGIPCVLGVEKAESLIKSGWLVTVNGTSGQIFSGGLKLRSEQIEAFKPLTKLEIKTPQAQEKQAAKTAMKIFGSLKMAADWREAAAMAGDGVFFDVNEALLRMDVHPKSMGKVGKSGQVVDYLAEILTSGCQMFGGRRMIYMTSDLLSSDYQKMRKSRHREAEEENPMLGHHGVLRHSQGQSGFVWEMKAVKKVRNKMGYKNLEVALTGVRHVKNLLEIKKQMAGWGLTRTASLKLWLVVDTPALVAGVQRLIEAGVDGVIIDMERLSQLWQGLDRENSAVRQFYDADDQSMDEVLEKMMKICHNQKLEIAVWYRSDLPTARRLKKFVGWGVDTVGVPYKGVNYVREEVAEEEKRMVNRKI